MLSSPLGSSDFRRTFGCDYAYVCGGMYRGIASERLVVRAGRSGILSFFGAGGLDLARVEQSIHTIRAELGEARPYGVNIVHNPALPEQEEGIVRLLLAAGVRTVEAAAFMSMTPALVWYRVAGLNENLGRLTIGHRLMGKVSRPELAEAFLRPAPERLLAQLVQQGRISARQAELARRVPMADAVVAEGDSAGHTDGANPLVVLPAFRDLRDRLERKQRLAQRVHLGAAGGIGTPDAIAASFILGADFVLTGSINQCTVEAGTSDVVKGMLQRVDIQDTDYAPAGDMFELGAKVQVVRKGTFFAARANRLYELYKQYDSLEELDREQRRQLEQRYFKRSLEEVYEETRSFFAARAPAELSKAEENPKHKMALVFRWYFGHTQRQAMLGVESDRADFQVHCGPALGAFNRWALDKPFASWEERHVDQIAVALMKEAAWSLEQRLAGMTVARQQRMGTSV